MPPECEYTYVPINSDEEHAKAEIVVAELVVDEASWVRTSRIGGNRPRSQPTPSGRRILITDNDIFGIFEPLSRHAQLTTKQLVAFDRRSAKKIHDRLTHLYHNGGTHT
jgi:hypothetical protein